MLLSLDTLKNINPKNPLTLVKTLIHSHTNSTFYQIFQFQW